MVKTKRLLTAIFMVVLLGSLAGCIIVDRGGYYHPYGYSRYDHDRYWDRR